MKPADEDRGSVALELAVAVPALLLVLLLAVAAGRISSAHSAVEAASHDAARAASLARSPAQAEADARVTAAASLADQHLHCAQLTVAVDTTGQASAPGNYDSVRVDVVCQVALADLAVPGLPGSRTVTASTISVVDPYRGRTP